MPTLWEEEQGVAGATNKELHVSDGREIVSAPGPKDCGRERPGPESSGGLGWTKGNPVVPAFDLKTEVINEYNQ